MNCGCGSCHDSLHWGAGELFFCSLTSVWGLSLLAMKNAILDPFVVHEHDDWVFTLLHDMCLPPNLVTTSAHYLSDVKGKKEKKKKECNTRILTTFHNSSLLVKKLNNFFPHSGFPAGSDGKESICNAGDAGSILGWEEPLEKEMATHSSILGNPMDRGTWQATVHEVA